MENHLYTGNFPKCYIRGTAGMMTKNNTETSLAFLSEKIHSYIKTIRNGVPMRVTRGTMRKKFLFPLKKILPTKIVFVGRNYSELMYGVS